MAVDTMSDQEFTDFPDATGAAPAAWGPVKQELFHIDNDEGRDLTIILLPWGQELTIAPGIGIDVVFEGVQGISNNLALSRRENALVITVRQEGVAYFRMTRPSPPGPYR